VRLLGQAIVTALSGAITGCIAGILVYTFFAADRGPVNISVIVPQSFNEESQYGTVNASALVALGDSTFLVVDDLTDDAFYELRFTSDGAKEGPLIRRPIQGLAQGHTEDFEGATLVESGEKRYIVAVSSLERNERENNEEGLVRVTLDPNGTLSGETMAGFRTWLIATFPEIAESQGQANALNVQGLTWDKARSTFLLGVRYPTSNRSPLVLEFRINDMNGAWETANLERVSLIALTVDSPVEGPVAKGVLDLTRFPDRDDYVVILGDSIGKARNAALYAWDGTTQGKLRRLTELLFHPNMKPEGIAFGTIAGKPAVVIVDDGGGYQVVWKDQLDAYMD